MAATQQHCLACGGRSGLANLEDEGPYWCRYCEDRYPASLRKAAIDPFDYMLGLTDGTTIRFQSARLEGAYATLQSGDNSRKTRWIKGQDHCFERGIDVRVDKILWCADAPDGS